MKVLRPIWKLFLGVAVTGAGWYLMAPEIYETTITAAAVMGIALVAVGVSILSEVIR